MGGGILGPSDLDLGEKIGSLDWGGFWDLRFGLRKKSWKFGLGGYSGTLRFGLRGKIGSLDFGGGILGPSDLDLGKKLEIWIWGGILGPSDLDLGKKVGSLDFRGGYSGTLRFGLSDNFHLGGYSVPSYYRIGVFCGIWTKISTTPAGSCITDSLSHTTYVETNYI